MTTQPKSHAESSESLAVEPADEGQEKKPISEKQLAANRANAQNSTGPTSDEGKEVSSQNPRKHNIFTKRIEPIRDGTYAEEPEEFSQRIDAIVESLHPRDAIEHEAAMRVAGSYASLGRLDRWSDLMVEDAALITEEDVRLGAGTTRVQKMYMAKVSRELLGHTYGEPAQGGQFPSFAQFVRYFGPDPTVMVRDVWDRDHEPSSDAEWEVAFRALRDHHWKNDSTFQRWASVQAEKFGIASDRTFNIEERRAAMRILDGPLELRTKYESRIGNELDRNLKILARLQQRDLPEA